MPSSIEVEHWILFFLQDKQRDLYKLLEDADVHLDFFEALTFNFESLEGKISNQMPSVSEHLVSLFQDAWMTHPLSNIVSRVRLAEHFIMEAMKT